MDATRSITVTVNDTRYERTVSVRTSLADFLRHDLGLTGTHVGCEHGVCGACTILMNGDPVRACLLFAVQADGADLLTIEGLATDGQLHPLQEAFWNDHGLQCGYCTPGMIMAGADLIAKNPDPTEDEVREALAGNLCRCTGYDKIIRAVQQAAEEVRGA